MKKWFKKNKEFVIEISVIIGSILLLMSVLYFFSKYFFPEWDDTPRGDTRLLASIALGILTNLKSIIEFIEKWFFKKDKYLLSEENKRIIEWMVNKVEENKIQPEFNFKYSSNEVICTDFEGLDESEKIKITKGAMTILDKLGFIIVNSTPHYNVFHCVIDIEQALQAIESNYKN